MYGLSLAKQAKIYAPIAFQLDRQRAEIFWRNNHFVDKFGDVHRPIEVLNERGVLSVIFQDGSLVHYH